MIPAPALSASPTPAFGGSPAHLHLTLTAIHRPVVDQFVADLVESAVAAADADTPDLLPPGLSAADLDPDALRQLLATVDLTTDRPAINKAIDAMDPAGRAAALLAFMDGYYTP